MNLNLFIISCFLKYPKLISKDQKKNIICNLDDVRGDFSGPPGHMYRRLKKGFLWAHLNCLQWSKLARLDVSFLESYSKSDLPFGLLFFEYLMRQVNRWRHRLLQTKFLGVIAQLVM